MENTMYRRGSGIKVFVCGKNHPEKNQYIYMNQQAGNTVYEDENGDIYVVVCKYAMYERK